MFEKTKKIWFPNTVFILLSLILSVSTILGAFIYKTYKVNGYATSEKGTLLFGGKINSIDVCCNGLKMEIDKPLDGKFLFTVGSMLYMWYNPTIGQCVLGESTSSGICYKPNSWPPCYSSETLDGTIISMGTTLTGPESGTCSGTGF